MIGTRHRAGQETRPRPGKEWGSDRSQPPNTSFSGKARSRILGGRLDARMGLTGDASRHLLMDPEFWRTRLERLEREPRQLAIFPRADLSRPGVEVIELRVRAHDGARLTAFLARSAFAGQGLEVRLRACGDPCSGALDFSAVESGGTDLVFQYPPDRRLEDRVLDVLRIVAAACSVESVDCARVTFRPSDSCVQDEFAIVQFLRQEGWITKPPAVS